MDDRLIGAARRNISWGIALALFALAGCAGTGRGTPPACPEPEARTQDYVIGAGDTLEIFVWREPDLSGQIPVRPDGKISISLVEDMVAVGKTPTQLARDMEQVLSKYIKSPTVNIIISSFQGTPADMIRVVGQAQNPQSLPYREGMTVLDVMIAVGGLGDFAAGNKARLVRKADGETHEIRLRLKDLINKGDIDENIQVQPGDVIIIPESFF